MAGVKGRAHGIRAAWRNASLKTVFVVYVVVAVIVALVLSACSGSLVSELRSRLYADVWEVQGTYLYDADAGLLRPVSDVLIGDEGATLFVESHSYLHDVDPTTLPARTVLRDLSDYVYASTALEGLQPDELEAAVEKLRARYPTAGELAPGEVDAYDARARAQFRKWSAENPGNVYESFVVDGSDGGTRRASPIAYWVEMPLSKSAEALERAFDVVLVALVPLWFIGAVAFAARRFYRKRLSPALETLEGASRNIADENLDFTVSYDRADEMGRLVESFEAMRASLEVSQRQLWRTAEERRRLNAAFAHDLRTPLTVLKGRLELLEARAAAGTLDCEGAQADVQALMVQTRRLERYVEAMGSLQKLEDRALSLHPERLVDVASDIEATAAQLAQAAGKRAVVVRGDGLSATCELDRQAVCEVAENLLSNALRFARAQVTVTLSLRATSAEDAGAGAGAGADAVGGQPMLELAVADDGAGFSAEALRRGTEPFYSAARDDEHFGLGLNICALLVERHGGTLELGCGASGGGLVTATFLVTLSAA